MTASVGVFGAEGRMGRAIIDVLAQAKENLKDLKSKKTPTLDVVIDFSSPQGTVEVCRWCVENKVPLVVGTTGLGSKENEVLKKASKEIPIFASPNMSPGVFGLIGALKTFLKTVSEGEIFIEEVHHHHKKDAPSGTAKALYEAVKDAAPKGVTVTAPHSIRAGDIFGIHRVQFFTEGEWVSFEHHATSRLVFAKGAVTAARWLLGQSPGLYQMKDMLAP